jgi:hypothetical protein
MKLSKLNFLALISVVFFIVGCGSPYLEKGFKSEEDYDFAKSANLSPIGVERFKNAGVSNPSQYQAAVSEMRATGYSNSNDVDDVLEYARDRFEGAKAGLTGLQRKNARIAEAARVKAAKLEAERLEAKRLSDERAAKAAIEKAEQEARAKERERRSRESEKYVKARRDALKKADVYETDVLNLIVNAKSYEGKQVFLQCAINLVSSGGGNCWSADDKQRVSINDEGIDKETFKWMLQNCQNQYSKDNASYCQAAPVVGTVVGSSFPRLKNVYFYELCKKRKAYSWSPSIEACDIDAHE